MIPFVGNGKNLAHPLTDAANFLENHGLSGTNRSRTSQGRYGRYQTHSGLQSIMI